MCIREIYLSGSEGIVRPTAITHCEVQHSVGTEEKLAAVVVVVGLALSQQRNTSRLSKLSLTSYRADSVARYDFLRAAIGGVWVARIGFEFGEDVCDYARTPAAGARDSGAAIAVCAARDLATCAGVELQTW